MSTNVSHEMCDLLDKVRAANAKLKQFCYNRMLEFTKKTKQYKYALSICSKCEVLEFVIEMYKITNTVASASRILNEFIALRESVVLAQTKWLSKRSKSTEEQVTSKTQFCRHKLDLLNAAKPMLVHLKKHH